MRKLLMCLVHSIALLAVPSIVLASQPFPFEKVDFQLEEPLAIKISLGRAIEQIDGAVIEVVQLHGLGIIGDSSRKINNFPQVLKLPLEIKSEQRATIRVRIAIIEDGVEKKSRFWTFQIQPSSVGYQLKKLSFNEYAKLFPKEDIQQSGAVIDTAAIIEKLKQETEEEKDSSINELGDQDTKSPEGNITVYGYWKYKDKNGNSRPLRYVQVELWDGETGPDEKLKTTYTDANGYYRFVTNNDDGWGQGGRDVYVKAHCQYWRSGETDKCAKVTDGNILRSPYWGETSKKNNVSDGNVNFGSLAFTDGIPWAFYDYAVTAYEYYKNTSPNFKTPRVNIQYPHGDWPNFTGSIIYYNIEIPASGWAWDDKMLTHEFSHATMYKMYGDDFPSGSGDYDSHSLCDETDGAFALIEGFAEFAAIFITGRTSLEDAMYADCRDDHDLDGGIVEGAVAAAMYDIADPANDDNVPNQFSTLLYILKNYEPDNMADIKSRWFSLNYPYRTGLQEIYTQQKIDPPPKFSVTIASMPPGRTILLDGRPAILPRTHLWEQGSKHSLVVYSPQVIEDGSRYSFDNWSDGGTQNHHITISQSMTYTVKFDKEHRLTTNVSPPGSGTVNPTSESWHLEGSNVRITATPNFGWEFKSWAGTIFSPLNPIILTMNKPKGVTANFKEPVTDVDVASQALPQTFALGQNYPNPFNPTTTFYYDVPEASHIRIDVFNISGACVATLVNKTMLAGTHQVSWNGRNHNNNLASSGIYFYRLSSGNFNSTKKMVLLK